MQTYYSFESQKLTGYRLQEFNWLTNLKKELLILVQNLVKNRKFWIFSGFRKVYLQFSLITDLVKNELITVYASKF